MARSPGRQIIVGVDGSAAADAAVCWAAREARLRRAVVSLVCANHNDSRLRAPYASPLSVRQDERRAAAQAVLDRAAELAGRWLPRARLTTELVDEPPARALLNRSAGAEMLVLGTCRPVTPPGEPPLAMGPVARICLIRAHCPVVVVAPDDVPGDRGTGSGRGTVASATSRHPALPPPEPVPLGAGDAPR